MNKDIKKAIFAEFAANAWAPMRRVAVVENVADRLKEPSANVRAVFNTLVRAGFIFQRGGWYVKAARPAPQPALERAATTPPAPLVRDMTTAELEAKRQREYDAWAGAHPVVGTEAHTLVNATSEALCREVVWRLATGKLPDALESALVNVLQARLAQPIPLFVTKHHQKMASTMAALRRAGAFKEDAAKAWNAGVGGKP